MDMDFLYMSALGPGNRQTNDLSGAIPRLVTQLRIGLDSLFFGAMMHHEQGIAALTRREYETILAEAERLTSGYEKRFVSYEHIADYAKSRFNSHIAEADVDSEGRIRLRMLGRTSPPLELSVFSDAGDGCARDHHRTPVFDGSAEVRI